MNDCSIHNANQKWYFNMKEIILITMTTSNNFKRIILKVL